MTACHLRFSQIFTRHRIFSSWSLSAKGAPNPWVFHVPIFVFRGFLMFFPRRFLARCTPILCRRFLCLRLSLSSFVVVCLFDSLPWYMGVVLRSVCASYSRLVSSFSVVLRTLFVAFALLSTGCMPVFLFPRCYLYFTVS